MKKNPAHRRHWISWRLRIVAPIQNSCKLLRGAEVEGWPMRGLWTDHMILGPMRGLEIVKMGRGQHTTHTLWTSQLIDWIGLGPIQWTVDLLIETKSKLRLKPLWGVSATNRATPSSFHWTGFSGRTNCGGFDENRELSPRRRQLCVLCWGVTSCYQHSRGLASDIRQ